MIHKYRLLIIKLMRPLYRRLNRNYGKELNRVEDEIKRLTNKSLSINIIDVDKAYDEKYFNADQFQLEKKFIPDICKLIDKVTCLSSVVDFGCGQGYFLNYFLEHGKKIKGYEGSDAGINKLVIPRKYVSKQDLRQVMSKPKKKYDLCISFEVAEHIEREFSGIYVYNLTNYSNNIAFTAFPPNVIEKHPHHPNEQPIEYWIELFDHFNYSIEDRKTNKLQELLGKLNLPPRVKQYTNMYIFQKEKRN